MLVVVLDCVYWLPGVVCSQHPRSAICLLLALQLSCAEPFPKYTEPQDILQGGITITTPDTVEVLIDRKSGLWLFVSAPITISVHVVNRFDDILEGKAQVEGLVTLQSFAEIPRAIAATLVSGHLLRPSIFEGDIALSPGDTAKLSTVVNPIAVDGMLVFEGLPGGPVFGPIPFIASGTVKVFERVQPVRLREFSFSMVFKQTFVPQL